MTNTDEARIKQVLSRGVENIFPNYEFVASKMGTGEQLSLYFGIDPTGPTLHIGHLIPLLKLSQFQKLGHKVTILIGDFTATIGDPTDKASARKKLSREEVLENMKKYKKQISRFIELDGENAAEWKFNSKWLGKMKFGDVLELASLMTVDQMLKRDMFATRQEEGKPIYIHEFLYPLMQGYDSVALDVDGEIGGNDQTFNMLAGRDLMKNLKNKEKFVIAMKLLVDPSGKKMGKSENNMVSLDQDHLEMFGKIMSWGDELIVPGFEIITDLPAEDIVSIKESLDSGKNPRDFKVHLARSIVGLCHGEKKAKAAEANFDKTFARGGVPDGIEEVSVSSDAMLSDILTTQQLVVSKGEYRRLVSEGAISNMDTGEKITDPNAKVSSGTFKIGKRRFIKIKVL